MLIASTDQGREDELSRVIEGMCALEVPFQATLVFLIAGCRPVDSVAPLLQLHCETLGEPTYVMVKDWNSAQIGNKILDAASDFGVDVVCFFDVGSAFDQKWLIRSLQLMRTKGCKLLSSPGVVEIECAGAGRFEELGKFFREKLLLRASRRMKRCALREKPFSLKVGSWLCDLSWLNGAGLRFDEGEQFTNCKGSVRFCRVRKTGFLLSETLDDGSNVEGITTLWFHFDQARKQSIGNFWKSHPNVDPWTVLSTFAVAILRLFMGGIAIILPINGLLSLRRGMRSIGWAVGRFDVIAERLNMGAWWIDSSRARVKLLTYQLWGGAGDYAVSRLEAMFSDPESSEKTRFKIALALSTWYDFNGDREKAIAVLEELEDFAEKFSRAKDRLIRLSVLYAATDRMDAARDAITGIGASESQNDGVLLIRANLAGSEELRLSYVNSLFERSGLATLRRIDPTLPLSLDNIEGSLTECTLLGMGKVSVIMPAFNAELTIRVALRSLLAQSYQDLEIIVIDDCSTDGTCEVVREMIGHDSRIQLIRQEKNTGTYPARNRGLAFASGVFITTHDADDWSHPQKIEMQLQAMVRNRYIMATITDWARVVYPFRFTTNWRLSASVVHLSHPSFLFRRIIFDRLGGWDDVRIAADTEFIWRVEEYYGSRSVQRVFRDVPLGFALDDCNSLTRNSLTHVSTIFYGLRLYYREISRYWIKRFPKGLTLEAAEAKRAMIPVEMVRCDVGHGEVDVWIKGDMTNEGVVARLEKIGVEYVDKRIGITHVIDPMFEKLVIPMAAHFCDGFFEFIERTSARIILPGAKCTAALEIDLNAGNFGD